MLHIKFSNFLIDNKDRIMNEDGTKYEMEKTDALKVLRETTHLQVSLDPIPGASGAWKAHFQFGVPGNKNDGGYRSGTFVLSAEEGIHFIQMAVGNVRSLRPGSPNGYFLLPNFMQIAEDNSWPIKGITYTDFLKRLNEEDISPLTLEHRKLMDIVDTDLSTEMMELAAEAAMYLGMEWEDLTPGKNKPKITH
jgi:hypothetical protein